MAATSVEGNFKTWLIETLNSSELDGEVYGDYIYGILEEGDEEEDVNLEETKRTELIDMLSGALATGDCIVLCQSIVERWSAGKRAMADSKAKVSSRNDPTVLLKEHIKTSKQATATVPSTVSQATQPSSSALSDKEKSRLIIQYGSSCAGSDEENESHSTGDLAANANKSSVTSALKEMREEQRRAHQLKTERDRENKKAQQQKQQERKEKEKKRTQKQERKR
ncbi:PREDICTED: coiled-coil domain-containing protein 43-like [Amphimedon queenslandica]|uniref:Coiled-coil domain-containing protein 43 n=1 Tax=Amphimedon queenslandica TaxID=400682 RepID=A0A1X7V2W1_AMPQE|nr:PREDICTED: coiled-coil domain-containing protein 43-like [Amphimedon queenslandica]|eukprot:XP_003386005.1 PREDICTED: coiled-coil domain-containing protein 43-like [Amphimedon queenslandica]